MKLSNKTALIVVCIITLQLSCQNTSTREAQVSDNTSAVASNVLPHDSPTPPSAVNTSARIPNELVCMVNNAFMGIPQIPVQVGDKVYYGCCDECKAKLTNTDEYRFGVDPLTGEKVDKASAFIALKSSASYEVGYFANEQNYIAFKSKK